jgi:type I restriction enzyme, R subunit
VRPKRVCNYGLLDVSIVEAKLKGSTEGERKQPTMRTRFAPKHGLDPFIFLANGDESGSGIGGYIRPAKSAASSLKRISLRLAHLEKYGSPSRVPCPCPSIVDRAYQIEAVKTIAERIEAGTPNFLMVLATGTGKTRVAVALWNSSSARNASSAFSSLQTVANW